MSDILLVNPLFLNQDPVEQRLVTPYFPLGLLYLAAVARDAGYDVAIFDAMFETSDDAFRAALEEHRPRLVGIAALATVRAAAISAGSHCEGVGSDRNRGRRGPDRPARGVSLEQRGTGRGHRRRRRGGAHLRSVTWRA